MDGISHSPVSLIAIFSSSEIQGFVRCQFFSKCHNIQHNHVSNFEDWLWLVCLFVITLCGAMPI